jgi:DNA-binding FadR family transcriptional regulator
VKRSLLAPAGVPPKAARLVADVLTERIVEGEYVPGDLLPSADDLIAEFGISRPTLREALNRLESAGFVSLRRGPGGGARVRAPDQSEVVRALDALLRFEDTSPLHIMEVRLVLEPAAAAMAALRATDDELDELEANLIRQASSDIVDEPRLWFAEKLEFQSLIAKMSRNPVIRVLTDSLRELVIQANLEADYTFEARRLALQHQRQIVKRLRARDPRAASAAARRHLEQSYLLPEELDATLRGVPVRKAPRPMR